MRAFEMLQERLLLLDRSRCGRRLGIVVGAWVVLLLAGVNVRVFHNDNPPNVLIAHSLIREGNVELSEFVPMLERSRPGERYWMVHGPGGYYSKYPIWTGVVTAPLFAPLVWWDARMDDDLYWMGYGRLAGWVLTGLMAGTMACLLRLLVPGRWAVLLTLGVVFGTAVWHHMGSHLTNQSLPNVCGVFVMLLILRGRMTPGTAAIIGLLAGLGVMSRLPAVFVIAAPLGVFLTRRSWRKYIPLMAAFGCVFPLLTFLYNHRAFGSPWRTGYSFYAQDAFTGNFWEGALGLLFSPTCGLLVYSPFLVIGLWIAMLCLRRRLPHGFNELGLWITLGLLCHWLLFAKWWCWNGALAFGSRMTLEMVPGLVVLIGLGWQQWSQSRRVRNLLIGLSVLAVLHHLVGTFAFDTMSRLNPIKPDWSITEDFIALYIDQYGVSGFLAACAQYTALFTALLLIGGYFVSLFFEEEEASPREVRPLSMCAD